MILVPAVGELIEERLYRECAKLPRKPMPGNILTGVVWMNVPSTAMPTKTFSGELTSLKDHFKKLNPAQEPSAECGKVRR